MAALAWLLMTSQARAQSSDLIELTWHAPAGCPGAQNVQERIRKLSGLSRASAAPLRAVATITRMTRDRLHLTLVVGTGPHSGERNIEGQSCEDLAGAAAVSLALLLRAAEPLGETALRERAQRTAGEAAEAKAHSAEETTRAAQPERARVESASPSGTTTTLPVGDDVASQRRWRGLLQLPVVVLGLGPMPRPSLGLALAGGVRLERWRILAEGNAWLRQTLTAAGPAEFGARVDRVSVALRACRAFSFGRYELAPCANVGLEHVWARGTGAHVAARTAESTWLAAGVGVQARLQLAAWLGLFGSLDAQLETSRPQISVAGLGRVGQLGPAAVKIAIGMEWIL